MFKCISEDIINIALYAGDTKVWKEINYSEDHFIQGDIDKLNEWSHSN